LVYNLFTFVQTLSQPSSPIRDDNLRLYQAVPGALKEKNQLLIIDESRDEMAKNEIKDLQSLQSYKQSLSEILKILDFYFFICRERPELKRTSCDDVESLQYFYDSLQQSAKYITQTLTAKYDRKNLEKRMRNIQSTHGTTLNIVGEIRKLFAEKLQKLMEENTGDVSAQETSLYEPRPLTVETPQQPDNSISD
jgi:hypothetical protein